MLLLDKDMFQSTTLDLAVAGESLGFSTATTAMPTLTTITMTTVTTVMMLE